MDGNLDILIANRGDNESIQLLKNANHSNSWIGLKLIGTKSNTNAIGAKVKIVDDFGITHYKEQIAGQSWASQNSRTLHVGLGNSTSISELTISWPSGIEEVFSLDNLNRFYTITENGGISSFENIFINKELNFSVYPNPNQGDFLIDFYVENKTPVSIELINSLGKIIFFEKIVRCWIGIKRYKKISCYFSLKNK